jgi:hypothetical protein
MDPLANFSVASTAGALVIGPLISFAIDYEKLNGYAKQQKYC